MLDLIVSTTVVLVYNFYSNIVQMVVSLLGSEEVAGVSRLYVNLQTEYFSGEY